MASSALQSERPHDVSRNPEVLPQEIVELIVDDLADDQGSLKACGLAGRLFVDRTRFHMFSTVTLVCYHDSKFCGKPPAKALVELIDASPRVMLFIQHFQLHMDFFRWETQDAVEDQQFVSALAGLVGLKSIFVSLQGSWRDLPTSLTDSMKQLFSTRSLERVEFHDILDVPLNVFEGCTNIKSLALADCSVSSLLERTTSVQRVSLRSLTYRTLPGVFTDFASFFKALDSVFDLISLHYIFLSGLSDDDTSAISVLLEVCGNSLTRMFIDVSDLSFIGGSDFLNLSSLKQLRKLVFKFGVLCFGNGSSQSSEDQVKSLLCAVVPTILSPLLEELCFGFVYTISYAPPLPRLAWKELDTVLTAPALEKSQITFRSKIYCYSKNSFESEKATLTQGLADSLPHLHSTGRMVIQFL